MGLKLYYTKGACSLACRIVINELNLPCEYISVDLKNKRTQAGENFLTINPKGAVPVLVTDGDVTLTENAVIQQYLADVNDAANLLPAVGNISRYHVLEWLNYVTTEIHKSFGVLFNPEVSKEICDEIFIPILKKKFTFVNKCLENKSYLLGQDFTLPDGYMFVMLIWATKFGFDLSDWPNLMRYFEVLKQRPSVKKSLEQEG